MSTLAVRLSDLATRVATQDKLILTLINGNAADLAALTTTNKTNLVAALNELKGLVDAFSEGVAIDDGTVAPTTTWSSSQIEAAIDDLKDELLGSGASSALDTFLELQTALNNDPSFATTISTALGYRVRVDTAAQGLNDTMKANARTNIGAQAAAEIGNPDTDFVAIFEAGLT